MPLYMDTHYVPGATADAVAAAHIADLEVQAKYGVMYHKYWFNESKSKIFCLCSAPNSDAATTVHREAHGLIAQSIIEVAPEVAEVFLGGCEVNDAGAALVPGSAGAQRDTGIRTVVFTDIVESTQHTQRLGDDAGMALLRVHDAIVRDALTASGGREVKHTGDGIMAAFASPAAAVRCAIQIQQAIADLPESNVSGLTLRIGAAAGEPVEINRDLFGSTVQLAARLCSHAEPKQTLVSNTVAELCIGKNLTFLDLGEVQLKGFSSPIRVHAVR